MRARAADPPRLSSRRASASARPPPRFRRERRGTPTPPDAAVRAGYGARARRTGPRRRALRPSGTRTTAGPAAREPERAGARPRRRPRALPSATRARRRSRHAPHGDPVQGRFVNPVEVEQLVEPPVEEAAERDRGELEPGRGQQDVLRQVTRLEQCEAVAA